MIGNDDKLTNVNIKWSCHQSGLVSVGYWDFKWIPRSCPGWGKFHRDILQLGKKYKSGRVVREGVIGSKVLV